MVGPINRSHERNDPGADTRTLTHAKGGGSDKKGREQKSERSCNAHVRFSFRVLGGGWVFALRARARLRECVDSPSALVDGETTRAREEGKTRRRTRNATRITCDERVMARDTDTVRKWGESGEHNDREKRSTPHTEKKPQTRTTETRKRETKKKNDTKKKETKGARQRMKGGKHQGGGRAWKPGRSTIRARVARQ